ncbi:MAG: helix-turn-helix domain-containing protein [Acidobacteriota bacterium]|nr:helix-turn-helix domain-containing protein [Acidobacteriota bacterium]
MQISNLVSRMDDRLIKDVRCADAEMDVYSICFLTSDATLRSDVVYFCEVDQLPHELPEGSFASFIVHGDGEVDFGLADAGMANIVAISPEVDAFACYNDLQGQFIENQGQAGITRRMLQAHFANKGLQYLVEEAATALGNPVLVVDTAYRYLAHYIGDLEGDDSVFAGVMRREMPRKSIAREGVDYIRTSMLSEKVSRLMEPYQLFNEHLGAQTMVGAVMVHGICVAHVILVERRRPFAAVDKDAFANLVLFVGQEMQKLPLYQTPPGEMDSHFLMSLLNDEQPNRESVRRRMEVIDFKPSPRQFVICVRPQDASATASSLEYVARQLKGSMTHSIMTVRNGEIILLCGRKEGAGLGDFALRSLAKAAEVSKLSVGISNPFDDVVDIHTYLRQARMAIKFGSTIAPYLNDRNVYHYRNVAYIEMLDIAGTRLDPMNFCDPALLLLRDYDAQHGTELLETLFEYLQAGLNTVRAADLLDLHKNTLLYRLGRIREVGGVNLSSGEEAFRIQVSFRALLYLGLFRPRIRVSREELGDSPHEP